MKFKTSKNFLPTLFFCTGINTNKSVKDETCCLLAVFFYKKEATAVDGGGQFSSDKSFCYLTWRVLVTTDGTVLSCFLGPVTPELLHHRKGRCGIFTSEIPRTKKRESSPHPHHMVFNGPALQQSHLMTFGKGRFTRLRFLLRQMQQRRDKPPPACSDGLLVGHSTGREAN